VSVVGSQVPVYPDWFQQITLPRCFER